MKKYSVAPWHLGNQGCAIERAALWLGLFALGWIISPEPVVSHKNNGMYYKMETTKEAFVLEDSMCSVTYNLHNLCWLNFSSISIKT